MPERTPRKRSRSDPEKNQDKDPVESSAPEPDPGVCERRRSGQFGYRPEDWPNR